MKNKRDNRKSKGESTKNQKKENKTNDRGTLNKLLQSCFGMSLRLYSWNEYSSTKSNKWVTHTCLIAAVWRLELILWWCMITSCSDGKWVKYRATVPQRLKKLVKLLEHATSALQSPRLDLQMTPCARQRTHSNQGSGRKPSKGRKILSIGFFVLEQSNRQYVKFCT